MRRLPHRGKPARGHTRGSRSPAARSARASPRRSAWHSASACAVRGARVYCLLSDGELQEGQTWEACYDCCLTTPPSTTSSCSSTTTACRPTARRSKISANVEPIDAKLAAFGFAASQVDANSIGALLSALAATHLEQGHPSALVCDNLPGKGVPSFEIYEKVHYIRAPDDVWARALDELG